MRRGLAGRQHAAMPGDDPVLVVDQDRVRKAELAGASGDLRDLRIAVRRRAAHVGIRASTRRMTLPGLPAASAS